MAAWIEENPDIDRSRFHIRFGLHRLLAPELGIECFCYRAFTTYSGISPKKFRGNRKILRSKSERGVDPLFGGFG